MRLTLVYCKMSATPIQAIIDDPLAGSLPLFTDAANGTNFMRSLLLRLRIYYSEEKVNKFSDIVIAESQLVKINRFEYIINELQRELRKCGKEYNEMFETVVLNNWIKDLIARAGEDVAYEFMRQVKKNREGRL